MRTGIRAFARETVSCRRHGRYDSLGLAKKQYDRPGESSRRPPPIGRYNATSVSAQRLPTSLPLPNVCPHRNPMNESG